jgi:hypothetical protein
MSRDGPIPLASDLERFLEAIGIPQVSLLVRLHREWPEIAGLLLAGKAHPIRFRNGILTIGVRNHAWAQELQLAKPALLSNIRRALGADAPVTDLRFVVGPPEAGEPEDRPAAAETAGIPPAAPDPEGLALVPDERTRESLRAIHRKARRAGKPPGGE